MIKRAFINIMVNDVATSRDFYTNLLGWTVAFDSDWFANLQAPDDTAIELGLFARDHDLIPEAYRNAPRGTLLTIVVDDVDAVHTACLQAGVEVVQAPRDEFYGQRRMLMIDPDGLLVDVSSPVRQ